MAGTKAFIADKPAVREPVKVCDILGALLSNAAEKWGELA